MPRCTNQLLQSALCRFLMAGLATGSVVVFHIDFSKWPYDFQQR